MRSFFACSHRRQPRAARRAVPAPGGSPSGLARRSRRARRDPGRRDDGRRALLRDLAFGSGARERYARQRPRRRRGGENRRRLVDDVRHRSDHLLDELPPARPSGSSARPGSSAIDPRRSGPGEGEGAGRQLDQIMPGIVPQPRPAHRWRIPSLVASGWRAHLLRGQSSSSGGTSRSFRQRRPAHDLQRSRELHRRSDGHARRPQLHRRRQPLRLRRDVPGSRWAYENGHTSGYPGTHWMRSDPEGWKVMLSYIARGFPVIALYATGNGEPALGDDRRLPERERPHRQRG